MPERRDPPPTDEGWYVLHDLRTIDWDAWRSSPERDRRRALEEAVARLESTLAVEDSDEGASALYSVLGHKADLLLVHMRPTTADIGALERQFETTEFAAYTERADSFVSVTEASGYSERARDYFTGDLDEDSGLYNYIRTRIKPEIPDATHVCFYPMDKRRQPGQNWYELSFEERAEHMDDHGEIGRDYGGVVRQMITGAIAIDDWEWGVTLWGDDLTEMKDLLYEMRFDPSTAQYADFGSFHVGRRFPPDDLGALLAGERVPTGDEPATESAEDTTAPVHPAAAAETGGEHGAPASAGRADGGTPGDGDADPRGGTAPGSAAEAEGDRSHETQESDDLTGRLATLGLEAGEDYGDGDYGLVLHSETDAQALAEEVDGLRGNFEHYDTHVTTVVRAQQGRATIVSVWTEERAADTAEGFLTDLPEVTDVFRGPLSADGDGEAAAGAVTRAETGSDGSDTEAGSAPIREELADLDVYAGQPHGEDIYALVLYSEATAEELVAEADGLAERFDSYDTHEGTSVYENPDGGTSAVVSMWETADAADTASGFLTDLPGVVGWAGEGDGFGTMGMFYTVKPEHRTDFVEKFDTVGDVLEEMDGHRETALLVNHENDNDMFIASRWESKEDAMGFFRSDAFTDTVDWGRDVLADRPRHVFLA